MKNKLINDDQILDINFRKLIIDEIKGTENLDRKNAALKRHEIYRDKTRKWVMENLVKENLKPETLKTMENRAANVSVCRKIVNKLARCYVGGVERDVDGEGDTKQTKQQVEDYAKLLDLNMKMKKSDRYRQLFKNTLIYPVPELSTIETVGDQKKYNMKVRIMAPWGYDVIEDYNDKEMPRVIILSDFVDRNRLKVGIPVSDDGRKSGIVPNFQSGDGKDQVIADNPDDSGQGCRHFIWWSNLYHFTTDEKGEIVAEFSPEDNLNPIGVLPFVNVAEDQDDQFWAQGGDDLPDGSILINVLLTDMNSIAYTQGWGQMVITGPEGVVPKRVDGGPHNALTFGYKDGEPKPEVTFESANPPIDVWMRMIEQYVALLLSTNDLSPGNISSKLDPSNFPSGIAMLIEQSEHTASIEDKQKIFSDAERKMWSIIAKWQNMLFETKALTEQFQELGPMPDDLEVNVKFHESRPAVSEKEKLEALQMRKDLGINSMLDLIKIDNPELSDEEAEEKLKSILKEKLERQKEMMNANGKQPNGAPPASDPNPPVREESEDDQEQEAEQEEATQA